MKKRVKTYLIIILALLATLIYLETNQPKEINWYPSYVNTDKIPLGTFVFYELLKGQKPSIQLKTISKPPYEFLKNDSTIRGTYVFINGSIAFDDQELATLLAWTARGNTTFIAAKKISNKLLDTLQLALENNVSLNQLSTQPMVSLVHPSLQNQKSYQYKKETTTTSFRKIDSCQTHILGTATLFDPSKLWVSLYDTDAKNKATATNSKINYIQQDFGKGTILLHTTPEVFSNYFILEDQNYTYPQNLMAYIDSDSPIFWDKYYKDGKKFQSSQLYMLLRNKHLKWTYYLILIGTLFFVLFEGKRKQRSIPIIIPLKNQTLDFTRTISGMYFEKQEHADIAQKQIAQFFDYIRTTLRIPTDQINQKTMAHIAARSKNTLEDTTTLFAMLNTMEQKTDISPEHLMHLHETITAFKKAVSK